MKRLICGAAVAITALSAQAALAQSNITFGGVRGEIQMGPGAFRSEGTHDVNVGFGGELGADANIGDKFVVGAAGTYWTPEQNMENTRYVNGGRARVYHKSFQEYGVIGRAGYTLTPTLMTYVLGGFVWNDQRKALINTTGNSPVNGRGTTAYYHRYTTNGWQAGVGAQYNLGKTFYVNGELKYSQYYHTSLPRATIGLGVHFR